MRAGGCVCLRCCELVDDRREAPRLRASGYFHRYKKVQIYDHAPADPQAMTTNLLARVPNIQRMRATECDRGKGGAMYEANSPTAKAALAWMNDPVSHIVRTPRRCWRQRVLAHVSQTTERDATSARSLADRPLCKPLTITMQGHNYIGP